MRRLSPAPSPCYVARPPHSNASKKNQERKVFSYIVAFALALAAGLNGVVAYEARGKLYRAIWLWATAAVLGLFSLHTLWTVLSS